MKKWIAIYFALSLIVACSGGDEQEDVPDDLELIIQDNNNVRTIEESSVIIAIGSGDIIDGISVNLEITIQPVGGTLSGEYPHLTYTPNTNFSGVDLFKYVIGQQWVNSNEATVTITVVPTDDPPTIGYVNDLPPLNEIEAMAYYEFTPSAADGEDDLLLFSVENLPAWAELDESTGALTGTPQDDDVGVYSGITITVSDGNSTASLDAFSIEVAGSSWKVRGSVFAGLSSSNVSWGTSFFIIGGNRKMSAGVHSEHASAKIYEYDTTTDTSVEKTWMITGRRGHTSNVIDGKIYVAGGESYLLNLLSSAEVYDIEGNIWSAISSAHISRSSHVSCAYGGKLYVFGGYTAVEPEIGYILENRPTDTVEVYNPMDDSWEYRSSMPRDIGNACVVVGDALYIFREGSYDIYDPISDEWTLGYTNAELDYSILTGNYEIIGDTIYAIDHERVVAFDTNTQIWSEKGAAPTNYFGNLIYGAKTVVVGDSIFRYGGANNFTFYLDVSEYRPEFGQ